VEYWGLQCISKYKKYFFLATFSLYGSFLITIGFYLIQFYNHNSVLTIIVFINLLTFNLKEVGANIVTDITDPFLNNHIREKFFYTTKNELFLKKRFPSMSVGKSIYKNNSNVAYRDKRV